MEFEELVSTLQSEDKPESIYDDIRSFHNNFVSASDAKMAELNAAIGEKDNMIGEKDKAIAALKARNYDLLIAKPMDDKPNATTSNDESPILGIDSLFGK